MFDVSGKIVVITGGTSGIGLALAEHFAQAKAETFIAGRRADGNEIAAKIGATFVQMDVSDEQQFSQALSSIVEKHGLIDALILNAGADNTGQMMSEQGISELHNLFSVNVDGVYLGLQYAPQYVKEGGSIIVTSSAAALVNLPTYGQYSASKSAVDSLVRTAALELALQKIRVNAVNPGGTNTAMLYEGHPQYEMLKTITPLGRMGETSDLVGLYHFLAADESNFITGQSIAVDGGATSGIGLGILAKVAGE